jgi:hypothetical protein
LKNAGEIRSVLVAMHVEAHNKLGMGYKLSNGYYTQKNIALASVGVAVAVIGTGFLVRHWRQGQGK